MKNVVETTGERREVESGVQNQHNQFQQQIHIWFWVVLKFALFG